MILDRLIVQSFRNLETLSLDFGTGFNIIHGDNAQGKTNILESIYLLGTLKSFRMAKNSELINWDKQFSLIKGSLTENGINREIALLLEKTGKKARVDNKSVTRVSDFFGILTAVLFAPEELSMIRGAPESRRRYLDRAIFAGDMIYLTHHHEYNRILKQRNSLLKTSDTACLESWSEQIATAGASIISSRVAYLNKVDVMLKQTFSEISGTDDIAGVEYRPLNYKASDQPLENATSLTAALNRLKDQELAQRITLAGPHRDDISFTLNGKNLRNTTSQGQQRCFVLALKMAEIELLRKWHMLSPVLLLDDMTSELDHQRTVNLIKFLADRKMQVFLTTTNCDNFHIFNESNNCSLFHVKQGTVGR